MNDTKGTGEAKAAAATSARAPLNAIILDALQTRLTGAMADQVRGALAPLTDEQLWWRPNDTTNSAGVLVLHLTGAMQHFINHLIGGRSYVRDRPSEFDPPRKLLKAELLHRFDEAVATARETIAAIKPEDLAGPSSEPARYRTRFEDLFNQTVHMSTHVGQLVYLAKSLQPGSVHEMWGRAHRNAGAWRDPE